MTTHPSLSYKAKKIRRVANEYYKKNRKAVLKKRKATYCPNKEALRQTAHSKKWKTAVFERLGNKCKHCGFVDARALQLDHIFGGGRKLTKTVMKTRSYGYYYRMLALSADLEKHIQILCANCNWIKRYTNNEV